MRKSTLLSLLLLLSVNALGNIKNVSFKIGSCYSNEVWKNQNLEDWEEYQNTGEFGTMKILKYGKVNYKAVNIDNDKIYSIPYQEQHKYKQVECLNLPVDPPQYKKDWTKAELLELMTARAIKQDFIFLSKMLEKEIESMINYKKPVNNYWHKLFKTNAVDDKKAWHPLAVKGLNSIALDNLFHEKNPYLKKELTKLLKELQTKYNPSFKIVKKVKKSYH